MQINEDILAPPIHLHISYMLHVCNNTIRTASIVYYGYIGMWKL